MTKKLKIKKHVSLLPFNTFNIEVKSKYLCAINHLEQLKELLCSSVFKSEKYFVLGQGSNILFTHNFDGLIIRSEMKGIEVTKEDEEHSWITVQAGENWHDFVLHALASNWGGVENLSLIPGTVGATPIQNIGAYGVEIKDVLDSIEVIDFTSGEIQKVSKDECQLRYRDSIFKNHWKNRFFILSITLRLTKKNHLLNTNYGIINELIKKQKEPLTIQTISKAIIQIRQSKLPNPKYIGNAGSFFKNPILTIAQYKEVKKTTLEMPSYPIDERHVKIPAGWLIEQCGWKGKKTNRVGVYSSQALILINHQRGTGKEILNLAKKIQQSVHTRFNIELHTEVTVL